MKWTIGAKLNLGVGSIAFLLCVCAATGIWATKAVDQDVDRVVDQTSVQLRCAGHVQYLIADMRAATRLMIIASMQQDAALVHQKTAETEKQLVEINRSLDELEAISPEEIVALSREVRKHMEEWNHHANRVESHSAAFETDQAIAANEAARELGAKAEAAAAAIFEKAVFTLAEDKEDSGRTTKEALTGLISVTAVSLAVICGIFLVVYKMNVSLRQICGEMARGVSQVTAASGQVSSASQSVASGATQQAASLEETTASLQEIESRSASNADMAKQSSSMFKSASSEGAKGRDAMERMLSAIGDIKHSSDETAKIIKTIDEIAFQTNLLALNAAVEAARAGEAGKGFAVVAEEVRNLAQRSAQSAKNTSDLIDGSRKHADNGVTVAREVAEALTTILGAMQDVSGLIESISAGSEDQVRSIEQINQAMAQMNSVTQANASNAEESAAASQEMSAQARELNTAADLLGNMVGAGDLGHREMAATAVAANHPRRGSTHVGVPARRPTPVRGNCDTVTCLDAEDVDWEMERV